MIVDANLLLYAVDERSPFHERSLEWLTSALNGARRVGIPWMSLVAFMRISTNLRATDRPMSPFEATEFVRGWLSTEVVWTPAPGPRHAEIVLDLVQDEQLSGNLISDAHLAAIAIEHGLVLASNDSDFSRFGGLRFVNPLAR
ncbi:MAG: TA system VapC family ribonuclease toxin [Acidimicrobiales bacterium]